MNDRDERSLQSLFARGDGPGDEGFVGLVMDSVERHRRQQRWAYRLAAAGVLVAAAMLAPWMVRLTGDGFRLLSEVLSFPLPQVHQLSLAAIAVIGLLGAGLTTWALRN